MDSAAQHIEELESGHIAPDDGDDDDDDDEEEDDNERETAVGGTAAPDTTAAQLAEPQVRVCPDGMREQNKYRGWDRENRMLCARSYMQLSHIRSYLLCVSVVRTHCDSAGKTVARARAQRVRCGRAPCCKD